MLKVGLNPWLDLTIFRGTAGNYLCVIRNPQGLGIRNTTPGTRISSSTDNLESGIRNPRHGI